MSGGHRQGALACWWICIATVVVFVLGMMPARAADPPAGATPAAVLAQPEHHFGTVVEGQTVDHEFVLQNKGSADLLIENLKSG
jgi:hypothetical protein